MWFFFGNHLGDKDKLIERGRHHPKEYYIFKFTRLDYFIYCGVVHWLCGMLQKHKSGKHLVLREKLPAVSLGSTGFSELCFLICIEELPHRVFQRHSRRWFIDSSLTTVKHSQYEVTYSIISTQLEGHPQDSNILSILETKLSLLGTCPY